MYFVIYRIVNLLNKKEYTGQHVTSNINDNYMGSGKLLNRAIKKYGIQNFRKDILYVFDNELDMNNKEKELVTEEYCKRKDTYNICPGGRGGFGYINANEKLRIAKNKKAMKIAMKNGIREKALIGLKEKYKDKEWVAEITKKIVQTKRDKGIDFKTRLGVKHTAKSIEKMKESHKGKHTGEKNSQYGTCWITDGYENKKCNPENIPLGWRKGRVLK